jgi:hypothetical protein
MNGREIAVFTEGTVSDHGVLAEGKGGPLLEKPGLGQATRPDKHVQALIPSGETAKGAPKVAAGDGDLERDVPKQRDPLLMV